MATLLFTNNAKSTLAGPINDTATSATLAAGSGVLFPTPGANQYFKLTFTDAATGTQREIVHVTAKSGDVLTIVRAQEGTTAAGWAAGDRADHLITAGTMGTFAQNIFEGTDNSSGGSPNAVNVPILTPIHGNSLVAGELYIVQKSGFQNTGPCTFQIAGGASVPIRYRDGTDLGAGDWPGNTCGILYYNGTIAQLVACQQSPQAVRAAALSINRIIVTATGSFSTTVGASTTVTRAKVWGAGAGGGFGFSGTPNGAASGGGGGAFFEKTLNVVAGQLISGNNGAPGVAGTAGGSNGSNGGDSSVTYAGITYTAGGGLGGLGANANSASNSVSGGSVSGTVDYARTGAPSGGGFLVPTGGNSVAGKGGDCPNGGYGGTAGTGSGNGGAIPGGGGAGSAGGGVAGPGTRGEIWLES